MRATYQPHSPTQPPHAKMWTTSCHRSHQAKQQRGPAGAGLTVPNMMIGTGALSWPCGARQVSGARPTEPPCQVRNWGPNRPTHRASNGTKPEPPCQATAWGPNDPDPDPPCHPTQRRSNPTNRATKPGEGKGPDQPCHPTARDSPPPLTRPPRTPNGPS